VARIGDRPRLDAGGVALQDVDAVLTRSIPKGSLEQVIFRVDALHWLERLGIPVMNPATAIERTVDKFYTSALLDAAGLPTPRTVVAERMEDAMTAFRALRDVIVKPLFGAAGRGMVRVSDEEIAHRVFRALDLERAVYYVQEALPHEGRDVRAFVVGDRVVAAAWRCAEGWRTNVAQGGRVERAALAPEWHDLSVRAARAVAAEYAGVDLLPLADGRVFVLEVNGIPGWQGLQSVTDVDVAAAIVEHLEAVARRS
jgi:RimK family alpha-L-glutamate ligase